MSNNMKFRSELTASGGRYAYCDLRALAREPGLEGLNTLPFTLRILAENLARHLDAADVDPVMLQRLARGERGFEMPYRPARVLLQDLLGVPVMVDLAALRDAVAEAGGDPRTVNPVIPVDFVMDHSLIADVSGSKDAARRNSEIQFERNRERFAFLAWCQQAFDNFRVVPPDSGIVHQINLERLARGVWTREVQGGLPLAYPDTLVCNDSHTPMVSGIGVLGWGVGGIEAEAAMLGRALSMRVPEVLGVRVSGELPPGATATDLVLTVTERLRQTGVVGKLVEFYGPGLDRLPVTDRATLANMAPEYGATCVYFPFDRLCLDYMAFTGRDARTLALVEAYAKAQGLWRDGDTAEPRFDATIELDLGTVERCIAGPRRPQERIALPNAAKQFAADLPTLARDKRSSPLQDVAVAGRTHTLTDGDVVIAAITSCTNTSNPANMIAAGLLARNAASKGLRAQPWVKTSFAPGSKVVMAYLERAGLVAPLEALGFHLTGFGCTTCNGNSGPIDAGIEAAIREHELVSVAVISGNRNFEGRVHPHARAAYLASPPLVVAYAIAGTMRRDFETEALGTGSDGKPLFLKDLWPSPEEVANTLAQCLSTELYVKSYAQLFEGSAEWRALRGEASARFNWRAGSTFLRRPPFFEDVPAQPRPLPPFSGMRALAVLGDMITTDHLSPNNTIASSSVAARYLGEHGVAPADFQTYGFRRGNHEVAIRGTFASGRLRNALAPGREGPYTTLQPEGEVMPIFDAAERYRSRGVPLVVFAGREYGAGSSRDWAAKGPALLGVRLVVAESFERIHRANLVGMGVLPVELIGIKCADLGLDGSQTFDLTLSGDTLKPGALLTLQVTGSDGSQREIPLKCRIDTEEELQFFRHGGLLPCVYRELLKSRPPRAA
ncbi:MAG: aconitate hydratase AcnA [Burkholderiales bacterium]|nr:aconitate hydratase AcnA [Burkholderiales bacterium]